MWDVVWTDPNTELVGEHKARKEKDDMFKKDDKSQPRRRSASTASSRWSTDSPFAIFRTRGSKKANASSSNAEMASSGSSGVASPVMASSDRSPMSRTFDEGSRRSSSRMSTSFLERLANFESPLNTSPLLSEKSGDACRRLFFSSAIEDIPSSPSALKRFSIAGSASDDLTEAEKMRSLVQIFRRSPSTVEPVGNCPPPSANNAVAPAHLAPGEKSPSLPLSPMARSKFGPAAMQVSQIDSHLASANASTKTRITPNSPEAWKLVDEWEPLPLLRGSPELPSSGLLADTDSSDHSPGHNDFRLLHAAVVRMASKNVAEILVTLEALWKNVAKKDAADLLGDSPVVEDLRRWMLSTMIHMDQVPTLKNRVSPRKECLLTARMVVCLYDSAEENLLRNLAKQGKCMSPSTAFPHLLAQAHLRGDGSTLTTTKFYAVPGSAISKDQDEAKDSVQTEKEAKAQVRSLVGRMLWVEVWGPYVTCKKWWWDDPECVAECLELGTLWEYHAVKGAKELKAA
ncbi:hypothetical protein ACHAPE_004767 [Trichoderma viride]